MEAKADLSAILAMCGAHTLFVHSAGHLYLQYVTSTVVQAVM
jgi:hypothetical protein